MDAFPDIPVDAAHAAAAPVQGNAAGTLGLQKKWIKREPFPQTEAGGNHQKQIKIKTSFQQETMEQVEWYLLLETAKRAN